MNRTTAFRKPSRLVALLVVMMIFALEGFAQRRVTPVRPVDPNAPKVEKTEEFDKSRLKETIDANGNSVLVDTITGQEYVDSTLLKAPPKMEYPLLHQVLVGVNFWDMAMRAFGQSYGIGDVWGELSMHNRYFPYFAFGFGNMNSTPANQNFTFKVPVSPYFKIGASYNFLYNSNPDYRLQMGLRYGFSSFKWGLSDVTVDQGYWQDPTHFELPTTGHTTGWLELTLGIKVKIWKNISMGWHLIYHSVLHDSKGPHGQPMYIPGYGTRKGAITGNFSVIYTIPLNKKTLPEVETIEDEDSTEQP